MRLSRTHQKDRLAYTQVRNNLVSRGAEMAKQYYEAVQRVYAPDVLEHAAIRNVRLPK